MAREDKSNEMTVTTSSAGFYYSVNNSNNNIETQFMTNQIIQTGFAIGSHQDPAEIFNLTTGMENMMAMGFTKNNNNNNNNIHQNEQDEDEEEEDNHEEEDDDDDENLMVGGWGTQDQNRFELDDEVDDSSLRCVFPCEGNERPSQGLSLSLSSSNPSSIGLQSFELRQHSSSNQQNNHHQILQQQQQAAAFFQLRNSRFLAPAQDLLNDFCSLGIMNNGGDSSTKQKGIICSKNNDKRCWEFEQNNANNASSSSSSSRKQAADDATLQSIDFMDLQKRKTKLFTMLEEVERRYRHYCAQMKAVVSCFEGVAGNGAAMVYSALASKAMSRHFRCLKDGIIGQILATKKAMGEKDPIAPGTTRGETPRLRAIDQALRQQKAFQQITMMEAHPWRPQRGLPERSVSVLRAWLFEHFLHPYPSDVDKHILARQTGLSRSQVSNWFINARVRLWKPMVEEMYLEETREQDEDRHNYDNNNTVNISSDGRPAADLEDINGITSQQTHNNHHRRHHHHPLIQTRRSEDQKPTPDQLLKIDSECLSSVLTNSEKNSSRTTKTMQNHHHHHHHPQLQNHSFGRVAAETFGAVELDFSSYNHGIVGGGVSYPNDTNNSHHFTTAGGGGVGGVSLTLGLQQHAGGNGVSIAFSPATESSLFYTRDHTHMEDCQPVQYSLLDGETQNNLPYRNLMGAQLLHDLAG